MATRTRADAAERVQELRDQLVTLLDAGQIDLLVGIAYNEERAQRYHFSRESLLGNWGMVYARPGAIFFVRESPQP